MDIREKENKYKLHIKCEKCQYERKHMVHLNDHMREKHWTNKCEKYLHFVTDNIAVLGEHMRDTHRIYKCSYCVFTSSSDKGFKVNITKSHTFKCDFCDSNLRNEYHFQTHIMEVHEIKQNKTKHIDYLNGPR